MPLDPSSRTSAIFNAISASDPNWSKLSSAEQNRIEANIQTVFGADLAYLVANTQVNPTALITPSGAAVDATGTGVAPGSPLAVVGTVVAPTSVTGTGTIS